MRRPWIKLESATPDKPEICAIATRLRLDTDSVVGKLVRLWSWAEVNRVNGNDIGVTKEFLDKLVGRKGFADALEAAGWLIVKGESLQFPNFERHNGNASKIRGQTAKRVERHRQRVTPPQVTPPAEEVSDIAKADAPGPTEINPFNDVNNVIDSLKSNTLDSAEHRNFATEDISESSLQDNVPIVTSTAPDPSESMVPGGSEAEAGETESGAKLPRLPKRSIRPPSDDEQPLLF